MNIYQKLQTMRVALQDRNLKKSGENKFSKFSYYELADILPHINQLMLEHNVTSVISYSDDTASLTLIDADKPEDILVFYSPMGKAELKGNVEIQNLGAAQSYMRRYLYLTVFEIVESDVLDIMHDKPRKGKAAKPDDEQIDVEPIAHPTETHISALCAMVRNKGYTDANLRASVKQGYECTLNELTMAQYNALYALWDKAGPKTEKAAQA